MCVCVCPHISSLRPAQKERVFELSSFLLPPCRKKNMDQGLNNTSHCGKYVGLQFPLGAASSRLVNMSDRPSLTHTHTHARRHTNAYTNKAAPTCFVTTRKRIKQTSIFAFFSLSIFFYGSYCFLFKETNKAIIRRQICQIVLLLRRTSEVVRFISTISSANSKRLGGGGGGGSPPVYHQMLRLGVFYLPVRRL